ncbi:hypothetical protein DIPPA_05133 [Diplonema papillatum]|nr:hypothetical protein DIPPA_05133 [Diplonema papillatum]
MRGVAPPFRRIVPSRLPGESDDSEDASAETSSWLSDGQKGVPELRGVTDPLFGRGAAPRRGGGGGGRTPRNGSRAAAAGGGSNGRGAFRRSRRASETSSFLSATESSSADGAATDSSTGAWGPRGKIHGDLLFEAMGTEYEKKRIRALARQQAAERLPFDFERQASKEAEAAHRRAERARRQADKERDREQARNRNLRQDADVIRSLGAPARLHPHTPRIGGGPLRGESDVGYSTPPATPDASFSFESEPHPTPVATPRPRDAPGRKKAKKKEEQLPADEEDGAGSDVSVDFDLYAALRPTTQTPVTRGCARPFGGRAGDRSVGGFRKQLREDFWRNYMHSYDRICVRAAKPADAWRR